jgi:hypothetical protein
MGRFPAAFALLFVLLGCFAHAARADQPSGGIYVTTLPAGANLWVDGTYVGGTPVLVDALAPGHHSLTITKSGWIVQEVDVTVTPGSVAMSSTRLQPGPQTFAGAATGTVDVRGAPSGPSLSLDGGPPLDAAGAGRQALAAGPHHVTLTTPRGKTTRSFTILPGMTTLVVLHEEASGDARRAVLAPAADYLPTDDIFVEGKKIVLRYGGHVVVAHFGDATFRYDGNAVEYDSMPETIGSKLYMPLALLEKLAEDPSKDP